MAKHCPAVVAIYYISLASGPYLDLDQEVVHVLLKSLLSH